MSIVGENSIGEPKIYPIFGAIKLVKQYNNKDNNIT